MKRNLFGKGLVAVVILLFLSLAVQPSMATVSPIEENILQQEEEKESTGLKWKTYKNCDIYGERYMGFGEMFPIYPRFFAFIILIDSIESCILSGAKGEVEVDNLIGFVFTGQITPPYTPRDPGIIDGHLLFCYYTEPKYPSMS
jgi:hypothetical protein